MYKKITRIIELPGLIIIITGLGLRFFHLRELFHFTYDEEVFAFVGKRMFVNGHIPLIGGVTPMHVHVAPYFYWLSGVWLWLSKLDPLGWGVLAALVSTLTMLLIYYVGTHIFGKRAGYIALIIYAFSFYQNIFDRHYWGLVFNGFTSLVVFFSLYQIIHKKYHYVYALALALAFGIHTDLSTLTLFVLTAIVILLCKPKIPKRMILYAICILAVSFLPLIVFDLRHDFANSRGIVQYISEIKQGKKGVVDSNIVDVMFLIPRTLGRTLYVFGDADLAKQYSYCSQHLYDRLHAVPTIFALFVCAFAIYGLFFIRFKNSSALVGITLSRLFFMSLFIGVSLYGFGARGDLFDHYLSTLFPIWYLVIAFVISHLSKKKTALLFLCGFIFVFLNTQELLRARHSYGYADKTNAVRWAISKSASEPFSLDAIGDCFRYNGYRYLFYLNGKEPAKSYVDANFTYLYDVPPATNHPKQLIVIANPDSEESKAYWQEYNWFKSKQIDGAFFGRIEVMLIDNSNLDFVGKY